MKPKTTNRMKRQNARALAEASTKSDVNPVNLQFDLPVLVMILQTKAEIREGSMVLSHDPGAQARFSSAVRSGERRPEELFSDTGGIGERDRANLPIRG